MEQRISLITLGVNDFERSRRFYEDGLGWKPARLGEDAEIAFYQLNGLVLALYPIEELAKDADQITMALPRYSGIALAYNVRKKAEVDAVLRQAVKAGGELVKSAKDVFWGGYSGYFADPDGHLWEVAWNPGWAIGDDGSVVIEK